jgi:hypothetical protein
MRRREKKKVLGGINRLNSFDTTRTAQKTMRSSLEGGGRKGDAVCFDFLTFRIVSVGRKKNRYLLIMGHIFVNNLMQ